MKIIPVLIISMLLVNNVSAQNESQFTGDWMGKLMAGAVRLRMVLHISKDSTGKLITKLDSPDQGVNGIATGSTSVNDKSLTIEAPNLLAKYEGVLVTSDTIAGKWTQGGNTFDLNLYRQTKPFVLVRPQEPKAPFPYHQKEVTFTNSGAGIELSGTLTLPEGTGPFPAVVMVTGSGPQNRNEELLGHKPFLVIADYLSRNGIAVLRYDDRGVGKSKGKFSEATTFDFANDAEAAFKYLETVPEIDKKHIGIGGHSEGGLIAPIIASRDKEVSFIVLLAGPGVTGEKILYAQAKLIAEKSGASSVEVEKLEEQNRKLYGILKSEPDNEKALPLLRDVFRQSIQNNESIKAEDKEKAMQGIESSLTTITSPWFRSFLTLDPQLYLRRINCPVLAMNGSLDLQVPCDENLKAIGEAMKVAQNKHFKPVKFEGLNHLFQHCKTGLPAEYGEIEETFAPEALSTMKDFILSVGKK